MFLAQAELGAIRWTPPPLSGISGAKWGSKSSLR